MLYAQCLPKLKELRDETLPTHVSSKACYLVSEQVAQGYGMGEGMTDEQYAKAGICPECGKSMTRYSQAEIDEIKDDLGISKDEPLFLACDECSSIQTEHQEKKTTHLRLVKV
jgi:uncharacterized protein with PIN domain